MAVIDFLWLGAGGAVAGRGAGLIAARFLRSHGDTHVPRASWVAVGGAVIGIIAAALAEEPWIAALLGWCLLALGIVDARRFWLPRLLTLPLVAGGLGATFMLDRAAFASHAIGAAVGFLVLAGVAATYRRLRRRDGLGGGDAKLFAACGAWLGWAALPMVLAVASLGGLAAALLIWRGRPPATARLPFGVFLGGATWAVYLLR